MRVAPAPIYGRWWKSLGSGKSPGGVMVSVSFFGLFLLAALLLGGIGLVVVLIVVLTTTRRKK
jgi:hypothetical protein